MIRETALLIPIGCFLLHKTALLRLRDIVANLSNTQKKYQEAAKMGRQRNMTQMKEKNKSPGKEQNEMRASNLHSTRYRVLNNGYRILKGLSENFDKEIASMKKHANQKRYQSET